jgi:hypothetical protein
MNVTKYISVTCERYRINKFQGKKMTYVPRTSLRSYLSSTVGVRTASFFSSLALELLSELVFLPNSGMMTASEEGGGGE